MYSDCRGRLQHKGSFGFVQNAEKIVQVACFFSHQDIQCGTQLGPEHEINLCGAPYELVNTLLELMTDVISEGSGEHVCLHNLVRVSLTNKF